MRETELQYRRQQRIEYPRRIEIPAQDAALTQVRYSYSTYNDAWGTVGDSRNPEILGGQVEFRAVRQQSDSSTFTVPRTRLQFMGYAFDPDFRYNVSFSWISAL